MKTGSIIAPKGNQNEAAEKLTLYDIHGKLGILHYEFFKAMSPLRAIIKIDDAPGNEDDDDMVCEDAINLASVALVALMKTNDDLRSLFDRIEMQDMAESRARQAK
jgi:hypothetical protein